MNVEAAEARDGLACAEAEAAESHAGFVRVVPWAGLALVLVPFLVSIVALLVIGGRFHAVSDQALEEMLTRDVGHHAVLLGPFSRDHWSHLGPAMFYLLAIPYRLTGSNSVGMWIGAAILNASAVTAMAVIAKRHGGTALMMLTLLGCSVLMRALGADFLRNPWNPYLPVLPFGALIFFVWAMACGDAWALPIAAAIASFCAQTHISYVVLAVPLFLGGAAWLVWIAIAGAGRGNVRPPSRRSLLRAWLITVGVLVAMWLPPLIQQFTHSPGNLTTVLDYFRSPPPGPRYNVAQGYRVVAGEFGVVPQWIRGLTAANLFTGEPQSLNQSTVPLLFAGFVAGSIALWRRRVRDGGDERGWRLAAIIAVTLVLGIASIARTVGIAYEYRLRWSLLVGMLATVTAAWGLWTAVERHVSLAARRALLLVTLLALGVLAGAGGVSALRAGTPQRPMSKTVSTLAPATLEGLPPGAGDVIVESPDAITGAQAGLVLWLERHGVRARVDGVDDALSFGAHRVHRAGRPRAVITVASDTNADDLATRSDQRVIASTASLPLRQQVNAEIAELDREAREHKLPVLDYYLRKSALLTRLGHVTAVFLQGP